MDKELIIKIADRVINGNDIGNWNMDIDKFDWCPGVGLYGIFKAYETTGEQKYLDFLNRWSQRHISEAYAQKTVNSVAPLQTVAELWRIGRDEKYLKVCSDIAEWVINEASLTREGGLEHTVTEGPVFKEQIWADTLFMVCLFLVKFGKYTNREKYVDFALNQFKIHYNVLQDKATGLCFHGWDCENKNNLSGIFWGRANAWIIYSTAEMLNICDDFIGRDEIIENFKSLAAGLSAAQKENGMFGTVLNDAASPVEVSASMGIVCGIKMGIDAGYLPSELMPVYEKTIKVFPDYLAADGSVTNVSTGTPIMESAEAYNQIPLTTALYGQCLSILALI